MNSIENGLWSMEVGDRLGVAPIGVIAFSQGKVYGGNDKYFYVGNYRIENDTFQAEVKVTHYNDIPDSLFGSANELSFTLCGGVSGSEMDLLGSLPACSDREYTVRLHKLASI